MPHLSRQRCFNHAEREAAARCLGCRQYFCRECVTEHDDRVLCAVCLQKSAARPSARGRSRIYVRRLLPCAASLFWLWFVFYLAGEALLRIPASFHEQTLWHNSWRAPK